jgi:membrane-associated phospholipid phosphatase
MRRRLRLPGARVLPRGWIDLIRQFVLFASAVMLYQLVRGLIDGPSYKPFGDATKIIDFERVLHVFAEPSIQAWVAGQHWLMDFADWTYLNAQFFVTIVALAFIYLRRNDSFYFVRNMFMIAMALALVGYTLYPTAPPRLMPEWGFSDSISRFLGTGTTWIDNGPEKAFTNFYAAVPSMHVCFALMVGLPLAKLIRVWPLKLVWSLYPLLIMFVVVATGNHYFLDVLLGALTAGASALVAGRLLARARPDVWTFGEVTA